MACPDPKIAKLTRRAEFLRAARARRQSSPGFTLQAHRRAPDEGASAPDAGAVRVGFTCSRKVGNAVARNRAKRRLRALARAVLPAAGQAGWDYVLIGRAGETATRNFAVMEAELRAALARIHAPARAPARTPSPGPKRDQPPASGPQT